jgi:hypothetical protein
MEIEFVPITKDKAGNSAKNEQDRFNRN